MENNLDIDFNKLMSLSIKEKIDHVYRIRIEYKRILDIKNQILEVFETSKVSQEPESVVLIGPMGAGKSTVLDMVMEEFPRVEDGLLTKIKTVRATIYPDNAIKSFLICLLDAIQDPRFDKGSKGAMIAQVKKKSKSCGIQNFIMDEIQHIIDGSSGRVVPELSELLKFFIKECHWSTVLCGLEGKAEIIVKTNPQLFRLFPDPIILHPFQWDIKDKNTIVEFKTLLFEIEKKLPFKYQSHLDDENLAWPIYYASQGLISWVMILIRTAAKYVLEEKRNKIEKSDLARAFSNKLAEERRDILNPFIGPVPVYPAPMLPAVSEFYDKYTNKRSYKRKPLKLNASEVL